MRTRHRRALFRSSTHSKRALHTEKEPYTQQKSPTHSEIALHTAKLPCTQQKSPAMGPKSLFIQEPCWQLLAFLLLVPCRCLPSGVSPLPLPLPLLLLLLCWQLLAVGRSNSRHTSCIHDTLYYTLCFIYYALYITYMHLYIHDILY